MRCDEDVSCRELRYYRYGYERKLFRYGRKRSAHDRPAPDPYNARRGTGTYLRRCRNGGAYLYSEQQRRLA